MRVCAGQGVLEELIRYRPLFWCLTWRDIRVRYKQSLLGLAWAVLLPLCMMLVFTFVFTRAIDARSALGLDMPYALYAYVGLVPWMFFASSLNGCVTCLTANRSLVTKVYFPREAFPFSCIAGSFVDFVIAMAVLCGLMIYFHVRGEWRFEAHASFAWVPVIVLIQVLFTAGLGMMLAMANLFYRDVRQVIGVVLQLWMFVSAVVVPVPRDGSATAALIRLNPLVAIITAYRDCIIAGRLSDGYGLAYASVTAGAVFLVGWLVFRRSSYRFAERI